MMNDIVLGHGRCACQAIEYEVRAEPMIVHCCHCRWCQRETGSAFVLNALIELEHVQVTQGSPEVTRISSESGAGQVVHHCARCATTLWSHYAFAGIGEKVAFVRVGTLLPPLIDSEAFQPDVHIYTASKRHWLRLPETTPAFTEYYRASEVWSEAALARRDALRAG
ncbi:MAG: GFA family protein [Pseudomonadales bacterium]